MAKQNFQHHYSSLQCHMILQKSFQYADLLLKKDFSLLSVLCSFISSKNVEMIPLLISIHFLTFYFSLSFLLCSVILSDYDSFPGFIVHMPHLLPLSDFHIPSCHPLLFQSS